MSDQGNEAREGFGGFFSSMFFAFVIVFLAKWWNPALIPFGWFEFWPLRGSLLQAIISSWPIFVWGAGLTAIVSALTRNSREENEEAEVHLMLGFLTSGFAGVFEEIAFRWLIFYAAIVMLQLMNFLLLGWFWEGIPHWFYIHVVGPIADFTTFHKLHTILFNGFGWSVGAAVISSNGQFRDGHSYLGWFGWVNSWFMGMFFFYLTFHYGLIAAILVHFLYDLFIDLVLYLDRMAERKFGWGY
jgi:hypothetical protein